MQNGGARPGAGRSAGQKMQKTLEKEAARELVRQTVTETRSPDRPMSAHDALQVEFADLLEERTAMRFDVINVEHR